MIRQPIWTRRKTLFPAGLAIALIFYIIAYLKDASAITDNHHSAGWWLWHDQGCYYQDVMAWRALNLSSSLHYYFPGYALSALPFATLTPSNPFLVPDVLSFGFTILLLSLWASRLLPDRPWIFGIVPWIMVLTWSIRPEALQVWLDPWDTSPSAPLGLWCLLAALRFSESPSLPKALLAGLSAGLIADFRPIDAVIFACPAAICAILTLLKHRPNKAAAFALTALAGASLGIAPGVAAYLVTQGFHKSAYWVLSGQVGFDWHLLPLRWVAIMLSSKSSLGGGPGLIPNYPWIVTGIAGLLAGTIRPISPQVAKACGLLGTAVLLEILVYLSYRDLQPNVLFAYGNQHYFKCAVAVLVVTSLVFLDSLFRSNPARLAALAALLLVTLTLPWRLSFLRDADATVIPTPTGLFLPGGFPSRATALFVAPCPVHGNAAFQTITLTTDGRTYHQVLDFKPFPLQNGFLLLTSRKIPPGPTTLTAACAPPPAAAFTASYVETLKISPAIP